MEGFEYRVTSRGETDDRLVEKLFATREKADDWADFLRRYNPWDDIALRDAPHYHRGRAIDIQIERRTVGEWGAVDV